MYISQIEVLDKTRRWIYIEGEERFWLYRKDITELHLEEKQIISDAFFETMIQDKVLLYAKKKALELLERMDRSEAELRAKLLQRDFSEQIVSEAIAYTKKFHYLDDLRFASNFISMRSSSKSKKQICYSLAQKGVSKEIIEEAYSEFLLRHKEEQQWLGKEEEAEVENPEVFAIQKIVKRKGKPIGDYTKEELMKLTASLYRKGFSSANIRKVLLFDPDIE